MIYDVECVHCHETLLTTARIGDDGAPSVVEHLKTRHPGVLEAPVDFDDPGLLEIFHQVRGRLAETTRGAQGRPPRCHLTPARQRRPACRGDGST
jgi:hypothetical protein